MTEQNPRQLNFKKLKPIGYPSEYRQTRFTPASAIQSYSNNDIVRFLIQSDGVWDPYGVFLQIEVQYNDADQLGVALQIDNSAHSIINQLILTTNGQEIERIEEYDTIAAMLYDVNCPEDLKGVRIHEGVLPGNRNNFRNNQLNTAGNHNSNPTYPVVMGVGQSITLAEASKLLPLKAGLDPLRATNIFGASFAPGLTATTGYDSILNAFGGTKFYDPSESYFITPFIKMSGNVASTALWDAKSAGVRNVIQKLLCIKSMNQVNGDNVASTQLQQTDLWGAEKTNGNILYNGTAINDNSTTVLDKQNKMRLRGELGMIMNNWMIDIQGTNSKAVDMDFVTDYTNFYKPFDYYLPKYCGYQQGHSSSISQGYESFLSSVLPQGWLANGKFQNEPVVYKTKTFTIPLLSALFGIMLPRDNYKYIPLSLFQNLLFEFRINPYAFFTSGYKNTGTTTTMSQQSERKWQINRFEIWADIYYFDSNVMGSIMQQAGAEGLYVQTSSWVLGPQFPIANTSALKGTWQVNMGFESLRMLAIIFLLNDYATYSHCRKHFRVSHNVTQLQLKFGTKYYPPQPIQGHAGNYQGAQNNSQFYQQFQKCFGKLNNVYGECQINPVNYCIADRPYNVANTNPYHTNIVNSPDVDISGIPYFYANATLSNIDTFQSLPWFHENRCIGKCIYAVNLETFPNDDTVISGTNTLQTRPFEIQFNCDDANGITRASNMYVFCYADIIYKISTNGIQVLGK